MIKLPPLSAVWPALKRALARPPRKAWWLLGLGALLVLGGILVNQEMRDSRWQATYLSDLGRELTFQVEPGPSTAIRFPQSGPYDERLGYSRIPAFTQYMTAQNYHLTQQARLSPQLVGLADRGLNVVYPEKDQAGLEIRDCKQQILYTARFPERRYRQFAAVPRVLVDTLLFIEDRDLLSTESAQRNPAFDGKRFARALWDQAVHVVDPSHATPGGSTLVTQIEKYRHSPQGRTTSGSEKLRQMASASVRVYLNGENTEPTRQQIVVDYFNTVPLAAKSGYGEVTGLGDGMWVWYGQDFDTFTHLLNNPDPVDGAASTGASDTLVQKAQAFKQALSLMIAQRRPSYYLRDGVQDLAQLTDAHLRVLATAGVISPALRDAALPLDLTVQAARVNAPPASFITRKAINAVRSHLSGVLHVKNLYDLDRLDLSAQTTINGDLQYAATTVLRELKQPAQAKAAELYGHNMLRSGDDPSKLVYSFTLFEQREGANLLRAQTDNFEQPFDINEGARLNLGSTAKLRTLVNYLEIVASLHQRWSSQAPEALIPASAPKDDVLSQWALAYLAKAEDRGLPAMLEAAMQRRYSGNPGESFATGGGMQTFSNFEPEENHRVMSVREGFQHSVNLVFVRLMRDLVRYYQFQAHGNTLSGVIGADADEDAVRQEQLTRFANQESRTFMVRFFRKYQGKTEEQALALLLPPGRATPERYAAVLRSIDADADAERFAERMRQRFPKRELSDDKLQALYTQYAPDRVSWADRGYVAGVHPLEIWLIGYLRANSQASLKQALEASADTRQAAYAWLFKTRNREKQDKRIRQVLEREAFVAIARDWRRLGYPFESLTPSYASALGASGDRPAALAELMGIIVNHGMRLPVKRVSQLAFARGTPFETHFESDNAAPQRVLPEAITDVVRRSLVDVVEGGTARRLKGGLRQSKEQSIEVGGKTGTGDHRFEVYAPSGKLLTSRAVNRSATFVFLIGDRFFGTMTAYVAEPYAGDYTFTSALSVQLLKSLTPTLLPLLQTPSDTPSLACTADTNDR